MCLSDPKPSQKLLQIFTRFMRHRCAFSNNVNILTALLLLNNTRDREKNRVSIQMH